jgi:hypothetical protein
MTHFQRGYHPEPFLVYSALELFLFGVLLYKLGLDGHHQACTDGCVVYSKAQEAQSDSEAGGCVGAEERLRLRSETLGFGPGSFAKEL